uniref:Uncharacterized protein n=1 Tax=Guillardia theta TaxID=55529 RepID=A0A7S4N899_GUITH
MAEGEVDGLLGHREVEEQVTIMLVYLYDNLRGLVEGGREWEEELSSTKLSILFHLLHYLVRYLTKAGQKIANSSANLSPLLPFASCAIRLGALQVDVGRRMDLTDSLLKFLKALALYDEDFRNVLLKTSFRARSDLLAQAVVQNAMNNPLPLFEQILLRLSTDVDEASAERSAELEVASTSSSALERDLEHEQLYALRLLLLFCNTQCPRAHEIVDTPLFKTLIDSLLLCRSFPVDKELASAELSPEFFSSQLAAVTMLIPQLGPKLPGLIPDLLRLLLHCVREESDCSVPSAGEVAGEEETQQGDKPTGGEAERGRRTSTSEKTRVSAARSTFTAETVLVLFRHLWGLIPCHVLHCIQEEVSKSPDQLRLFAGYFRQLRCNERILLGPTAEADPDNWKSVNTTALIDYLDISSQPSLLLPELQPLPQPLPLLPSDAIQDKEPSCVSDSILQHLHRHITLLTSEAQLERYMRQQSCEQIREIQRSHSHFRTEAAKANAMKEIVAKQQENVKFLQEQLHTERQALNQLHKSKREYETQLQRRLAKNGEERQYMVEQLQQTAAMLQEQYKLNSDLMRDIAERDRRIVQLTTDRNNLAASKAESMEMQEALLHFRREVGERGAMQQELEELRSQVEMKDAQLRRLTDDRENIMKNSSRHVEEMNDRQVREEDLKQENEELKRQLKLAKEQIEKQNRIHVERSKLEECKYAEAKRINAILQTRLAHSKSGAA